MLKIQEFISEHTNNWYELLTSDPYNLSIKQKDNRLMFNYRQGISDYSLELVREARGLILNAIDFSIISIGFNKFFLYDSEFAATINWHEVRIEEKYDGSLITLYYYNNEWRVATSGCIDAEDATMECVQYKSFKELFDKAASNAGLDYTKLDKNNCYMFELVSSYNKIVVDYDNIDIIHIGTRNRITTKETIVDIGIKHPTTYPLNDITDCLAFINNPNYHGEGFVAVDNMWNRVKIKSDEWFKWHYINNNNAMNVRIALELIRSKDLDEYLIRYKHHTDYVLEVKHTFDILRSYVQKVFNLADKASLSTHIRKEQADIWEDTVAELDKNDLNKFKWSTLKGAYFGKLTDKAYTVDNFIDSLFENKLITIVEAIMEDGVTNVEL